MAAGVLIVREAGGLVESLDKGLNPVSSGSIIAASNSIFNDLSQIILDSD